MAPSAKNETEGPQGLTHLDPDGHARMVDVSDKTVSQRTAVAEGRIRMALATLEAIEVGDVKKGDVVQVARLAAISAGKRTGDLIPLCHMLPGASQPLLGEGLTLYHPGGNMDPIDNIIEIAEEVEEISPDNDRGIRVITYILNGARYETTIDKLLDIRSQVTTIKLGGI